MKRPQRGRINRDGAVIEEGLPGWAIERLFQLQTRLETALSWERDAITAEIKEIMNADYNKK